MMTGRRLAVAALVCGVVLSAGGAASAQEVGLTCKATGEGTTWNLGVTGASIPLGGFIAGYSGGTITAFSINGFPGQPDTTGLPPGTSNGLFAQIPSGTPVVLQIITSTPPDGPFNVAFINQAQTGYGPLFECPFASGPGPGIPGGGGADFTMAVGDFNADGSPDLVVTSPGPGTFFVDQVFPDRSRAAARAKVALVRSERMAVTKPGDVTVPLRATAAGKALLAQKGRFAARVKVTFKSSDGQSSSKVVKVTFRQR